MFRKTVISTAIDANANRLKSTAVIAGGLAIVGYLGYQYYKNSKKTTHLESKESSIITAIREYAKEKFAMQDIPFATVDQLSWLQNNSITTSEGSVKLSTTPVLNIEIMRSLSRANCLNLLLKADDSAYEKFSAAQPPEDKLTLASFKQLADMIRTHSPIEQTALRASCFTTMSDRVKTLATQAQIPYSIDSEKFVTDIVTQRPRLYPVCNALEEKAISLLPIIYLQDTHGRHMLYTEGGDNMFAILRKKISDGTISRAEYELWFSRWIVNIAGFRGHLNSSGSIYLNQKTANAIFALKSELDKLWIDPTYDVLQGYLSIRAKWLNVENNPLLAHLGCMLRMFTPEEGNALQEWFSGLSAAEQQANIKSYDDFRKNIKVTPTYEPAVFDGLRAALCSVAEAIKIHGQIKMAANRAYLAGIQRGDIAETTPLCFRDVALKHNLQSIVDHFRRHGNIPDVKLDTNGNIAFALEAAPRLGMKT